MTKSPIPGAAPKGVGGGGATNENVGGAWPPQSQGIYTLKLPIEASTLACSYYTP